MKKMIVLFTVIALFCSMQQKANAQNNQGTPPLDGVYYKQNIPNRLPIPYEHLREADVMWAKRIWRVIDMRQKINLPLYYPMEKQAGRISLMQLIYNGVMEGSLQAYASDNDEFTVKMTVDELKKLLNKSDTVQLQRQYEPYDMYDTIIDNPFRTSDVFMVRVKEDWFFDKQRSVMDVRIIGLCPIKEEFDDNGESRGVRPLFWVYYPEVRTLFANHDVFNRYNDAERRSFDDVITWKRMFGSYIYKENNVYDRKISQYAKQLDGLLEAERAKDDLFKMEHDLWEY